MVKRKSKLEMKNQNRVSLPFIAFLQAAGLVIYCCLVGIFFWRAERLVGPPYTFMGPALFLVLFVVSALIAALTVLGYSFFLFWEKKQTVGALRLVVQTISWLVFFVFLLLLFLIIV